MVRRVVFGLKDGLLVMGDEGFTLCIFMSGCIVDNTAFRFDLMTEILSVKCKVVNSLEDGGAAFVCVWVLLTIFFWWLAVSLGVLAVLGFVIMSRRSVLR